MSTQIIVTVAVNHFIVAEIKVFNYNAPIVLFIFKFINDFSLIYVENIVASY